MRLASLSACLALVAAALPAAEPLRFNFGSDAPTSGTRIAAETLFTAERGFGFEPGSTITNARSATSDKPFLFSVAVPEGNYLVTVTLGDPAGPESNTTVKAESRRLMLENVVTAARETTTRTFAVNVRNAKVPPPPQNAPGNDHVELNSREKQNGPAGALALHWDDKLTLEFCGPRPAVAAISVARAPETLPVVFLTGDSTVTDQTREPGASWGQMLTRFFKPSVAIANHAESGETLKSFITELRLDKVLSEMKRGDWLFVQFAHNDQKQSWPQTYVEARTTYKTYLKVFIAEARRRGAKPVLVTPMQRRQFDANGTIRNSHGDYPVAVREVALEENVPLIDLERASVAFYEALGPEKSPLAFSAGGRDVTHHNNYGAYQLAKCVAAGIRAAQLELAAHLIDDFTGFDPAKPDSPDTFDLAPSAGRSNVPPRGN
jgi:lysophospholipase L1-like esterase